MLLDLMTVTTPVDFGSVFGRSCPVEVELGCGNGRFLLEYGSAHPELALLGVERARVYGERGAARARRLGVANIRVVVTTAEEVLFRWLVPDSIQGVHVYFPDPWPKRRHHKRRILNSSVVARIAEVLTPGGLVRVKTDHPGAASWISGVLAQERRLEPVDEDEAFSGLPVTNFETRYGGVNGVIRFAHRRRE